MRRLYAFAMIVGLMAAVTAACTPARAAGACAWAPNTTNSLYPDLGASYWTTSLPAGAKATITGSTPDARYFAITSYTWYGGILSHVNDTNLPANYRVTVAPSGANLQSPPLAAGSLMFRAYLPGGHIVLPTVTMNGAVLPQCSDGTPPVLTPGVPSPAATTTGWQLNTFSSGSAGFPNPDNAYLSATIAAPGAGNVVVISGRAPAIPGQVRYWSLCTDNDATAVVDCVHDTDVPLDAAGFYHVALGVTDQRSIVEAAGGTFLTYSDRVFLRNLLGQAFSGDYLPTVRSCAVTDPVCFSQ